MCVIGWKLEEVFWCVAALASAPSPRLATSKRIKIEAGSSFVQDISFAATTFKYQTQILQPWQFLLNVKIYISTKNIEAKNRENV